MTSYDAILDELQSRLYSLVSGDATISSYTDNIVDGLPITKMQRGVGFPYIQIPTGNVAEEQFTPTKRKVFIETEITVFTRKASTERKIVDALRKIIESSDSSVRNDGFYKPEIVSASRRPFVLLDGKPLYEYSLVVRYEWRGVV